jgi:hypothetical protein
LYLGGKEVAEQQRCDKIDGLFCFHNPQK